MNAPAGRPTPRSTAAIVVMVIGIVTNMLGVVAVALRGASWYGFLLMIIGIGLLIYAIVALTMEARRNKPLDGPP